MVSKSVFKNRPDNSACQVAAKITFDATQIFGGYGFIRDNRIMSIGGGPTEIMNEIIAKNIL
jgi:acyl-CoA dehydrogenase